MKTSSQNHKHETQVFHDKKMEDLDSLNSENNGQLPVQQRLIIQMRDIEQYEFTKLQNIEMK
jgi:hypothetical protein